MWKGDNHMKWMQRSIVALLVAGALSLGLAGPAAAQVVIGDGLVNVQVGNITILEDVNVAVAAKVVALICNLKVGPVAVLGDAVDLTGEDDDICQVDGNHPITITQN
jgi:hypothetical protein